MNWIREKIAYIDQLKGNQIDHGDIFALQILPFFRNCFVWWTTKENERATNVQKFWYHFCFTLCFMVFPCHVLYIVAHRKNQELAYSLQDLAFCLSGIASATTTLAFKLKRKNTTELLHLINEKNKKMLQRGPNFNVNRKRSNNLFLLLLCVFVIATVLAILIPSKFFLRFIYTGEVYFKNYFFIPTPFAFTGFLSSFTEILAIEWLGVAFNWSIIFVGEVILRVSFLFSVTTENIRQLRRGKDFNEEEELRKLKELSSNFNFLQWCTKELIEITRIFVVPMVFLIFSTMGVYVVLILWVSSSKEMLAFLPVPMYQFMYLFNICVLGQHLSNSANEVRFALYDCNWQGAPLRFQKVLLNFMTQTMTDTVFEAKPLFQLNFELLATFVKKVYTFIAIVRKAI